MAIDRVVAPSAAFADAVQDGYRLALPPSVVRNGRRALALPRSIQRDFAFTAGRLWDEGKAVAVLDRAAARLAVPLRAAGPMQGPNGAGIELVHAHALGNLGEAGLARWLAERPVFVSAALYEPFGLAVLEAAQAGCALVLSDIATFRELWSGAAIFVEPGDDVGFARAVTTLIADPAERARRGRLAQAAAARYTVEAMADAMLGVYRGLLPAQAGRAAA